MSFNADHSAEPPPSDAAPHFAGSIQRTILLRTMTLTLVPLVIVGLFAVALSANALPTQQTILWGSGFVTLTICIVAALNLALAKSLADPIVEIARSATAIAQGDFHRRLNLNRDDEIGLLAQDFNLMSDHLQTMVNNLEHQVEERTQALEAVNQQLQSRAFQLETNVQINRLIAPILEVDPFSRAVVQAIQQRFQFLYVALLISQGSDRFVIYDAQTPDSPASDTFKAESPAGQAMISRQPVLQSLESAPESPAQVALALPLIAGDSLLGVLNLQDQRPDCFEPPTVASLEALANQLALALQRTQLHHQAIAERDRTGLLYEINKALGVALDFETIMRSTLGFTGRLGASWGLFFLQTPRAEFRLDSSELTSSDEPPPSEEDDFLELPLEVSQSQLQGMLRFYVSPEGPFSEEEVALMQAVAAQVEAALENTTLLHDIQTSLRETHLLWEISRQLAASPKLSEIYEAVGNSLLSLGADRCALFRLQSQANSLQPEATEIAPSIILQPIYESQADSQEVEPTEESLPLPEISNRESVVFHLRESQETLVIEQLKSSQLSPLEKAWWGRFGAEMLVLNPLVARGQVIGLIAIEFRRSQAIGERVLTLYRTLANQATVAMENARQVTRTEMALAETQTLYRAGRVLARAADLTEILEEALIEFLYSLGLDQGGIVLLNQDRTAGQVVAYVQDGLPKSLSSGESRFFDIVDGVAYQEILLAGQPFVSVQADEDPRLVNFKSFNEAGGPKSILQAPMIVQGETVGWIGADAVVKHRYFAQREIDMARAMADQIAIAMQNRRLLEQTQRRAEQLQAVAQIGESVSEMIDLQQILDIAVELICSRFALYHVSIFVVEPTLQWAVVRASAGVPEAAQTFVSRPHQLEVGGSSIVGFVTGNGQPRIALDVGQDAVWFNNPLLPETRSEMALPLVAHGGVVMGALDVQSQLADAFGEEDIEILQIMANQLTAAIEKAHLFEQAQQQHQQTQQNQQFLRAILNQLPDAIFIKDPAGRLVVVNHAFAEWLVGQPENQLLGQPEAACWPPQLAQLFQQQDEQLFSGGPPVEFEFDMPNARQQKRTLLIRKTPLDITHHGGPSKVIETATDGQGAGEIDYLIGVVTDITERKLQEMERERLMHHTRKTLKRTQALYEISHTLDSFSLSETGGPSPEPVEGEAARSHGLSRIRPTEVGTTSRVRSEGLSPDPTEVGTTSRVRSEGLSPDPTEVGTTSHVRSEGLSPAADLAEGGSPTEVGTTSQVSTSPATSPEGHIFQTALSHYLELLGISCGTVWLLSQDETELILQAQVDLRMADDSPLLNQQPTQTYPLTPLFHHLQDHQVPVVIKDVAADPLATGPEPLFGHSAVESLLALPLLSRRQLRGLMVVVFNSTAEEEVRSEGLSPDPTEVGTTSQPTEVGTTSRVSTSSTGATARKKNTFSANDIELGRTIAGQLARWLENRHLLAEAEYRATRLATVAQISQAASSILELADLLESSVNLIREQFGFYYVGLFMVEAGWAVLKAGTGQAGQRQLARNHRLKVGEGMIGWSVQHGQSRIALDVGEDAVRFANPDLPLTRSELALPLISRDEVLGALTVQSKQARAFSEEDITLLQTMADQLANAIKNAHLLAQTQAALLERERLYQISQDLLSAEDENRLFRLASHAIAQSGADWCRIFTIEATAASPEPAEGEEVRSRGLSRIRPTEVGTTSQVRSEGLSPDARSRGLSRIRPTEVGTTSQPAEGEEVRSEGLSPDARSRGLSPDARSRGLSRPDPTEVGTTSQVRSEGLSPDARSRGLSRVRPTEVGTTSQPAEGEEVRSEGLSPHSSPDDSIVTEEAAWYLAGPQAGPSQLDGQFLSQLLPPQRTMWLWDGHYPETNQPTELQSSVTNRFIDCGVVAVAVLPLEASNQRRLGFLAVGYEAKPTRQADGEESPGAEDDAASSPATLAIKDSQPGFSQEQLRFYSALTQQMVVALENLRLLQASQRRARREEIIRQITSKIHHSNDLQDIIRLTIGELGKITGSNRGRVILTTDEVTSSGTPSEGEGGS